MIFCPNCGKGIPDQSKFCTFCGTALAATVEQQPAATQPTHQQYVPPPQSTSPPQSTPPPQPTPPPQYVNPTPVQPQQQYVTTHHTKTVATKNEFYKNAGFWGAVLTFVGFFLPYINGYDASFYYLVTEFGADRPEVYLYLIFPISAAVLIIQAFTGALPGFVVGIFKILPLLVLILLGIGLSKNDSSFGFMGNDVESILSTIGIGFYMTVIGTILMLFFKTTKRKVRTV